MTTKSLRASLSHGERLVFDEESAILEFTEDLVAAMQKQRLKRSELAKKIGKTKSYVTQVLSGSTNFSFRTAVLFANAVGLKFSARLREEFDEMRPIPIPEMPRQHAGAVVLNFRREPEPAWRRELRTSAPLAVERV